jgi:hypothetical protein
VGSLIFFAPITEHTLALAWSNGYNNSIRYIPLHSRLPERRDIPRLWLCSPRSRYRKGAEPERAAVDTTRSASFYADGDSDKSGDKGGQKVATRNSRMPETRAVGRESATKSACVCGSIGLKEELF